MAEILQVDGIGVCRDAYGKQLGDGLFEFRLRHDAAEILRSVGKPARDEPHGERILLRVFCHAHGDRVILLLGGYDKGADPSKKRQQREIAEARRRLADFRRRESRLDPIWALPHTDGMTTFDEFIAELEAEARAEGPEAIAELEAFRLHFSLARQLAAQRRARRLTQKQLAEKTGIDQAEISRIERGQANPTTATLGALTRALGVDVRLVPIS